MNVIKVYLYLLNKWLWKTEKENESTYDFTLTELRQALGYTGNDNKGADSALRTILFSLAKQGIIDAFPSWAKLENDAPISPIYRLTFVAQHPLEFKTITTERAMALTEQRVIKKLEAN